MFNTTFVGVDVLGDPQQTNFGRDIVFSADLCYNGANEMPPFTQGSLRMHATLGGMGFAL